MSFGRLLRSLYLLYFSQPAHDRVLYKAVRRGGVRSIVELGIGVSGRTQRLLEVAAWRQENVPLRYTGIDLFEATDSGPGRCSLKQAFSQLRRPDVRLQLVPGDPYSALMRVANALTSTDLLLIAADQQGESLERAWTWIPRMLNPSSLVFVEESRGEQTHWRLLPMPDVQQLADNAAKSMRHAA